ncbi:DUF58 domain-containing protein [Pseudorhodoferax sp. Leaf267]|uniref:DUF58 domain-containing protein n=1 Tax=Pseudorhodoferax sp. Leaf267 TaxID=1736316 RepID=UPI0006F7E087|nr:DUF58 domain-containing protein [Pseudorhodoferax sp. Leaf267]KQP14989.1 hypothetical protein ASF43_13130 [Pseudorhodoferax sp. Leaf267]
MSPGTSAASSAPLPPLRAPHPLARLRAAFRHWWQARLPLTDTLALTQRNVYILPTPAGLMLGATVLLLLLASINYQLNLGYLLTFLLAGCALVGMHVGHATLRGLQLHLLPPEPQFLGTSTTLTLQLSSTRASHRHGIAASLLETRHWAFVDVPAGGSAQVHVAFAPTRRGLQRVPTLTLETRFPLGTFRVWAIWRPAAQVLVYPRPEAHPPPLPPGEPRSGGAMARQAQAVGEYDGVRGYRRGDPLKLVVWKKAAKAGELVSRDSQQAQREELWLDLDAAGGLDTEPRLARLCAWVLQADHLDLQYGLRLPGIEVRPGSGEAHKRRCLEALATC